MIFLGPYGYQKNPSSPYIPHSVSTLPRTYNFNNDNNKVTRNNYYGYYSDSYPRRMNNYYNSGNGNQGYYNYYNNYYNTQTAGSQPNNFVGYYGYNGSPRSPSDLQFPSKLPSPSSLPSPPASSRNLNSNPYLLGPSGRYRNSAYYFYKTFGTGGYQDSPRNFNNQHRTGNTGYYDQNYRSSYPSTYYYSNDQFPHNSYTGSCYACQNCQQCTMQAYCQGCSKCQTLPCNKKRPKKVKYMDPIDTLVEEFGRKTHGKGYENLVLSSK